MRRFRWQFLLLATFLMSISLTYGQVTTSGLNGSITNSKGETLPGATVVAVHLPSGTQYASLSNTEGRYSINNMRVGGPYKVTVTFVGYKEQSIQDLVLSLGISTSLNFDLQEASSQLSGVEVVSSRSDVFNSDRTGASASYSANRIAMIPTIGRTINDVEIGRAHV